MKTYKDYLKQAGYKKKVIDSIKKASYDMVGEVARKKISKHKIK